MLVSDLTQLGKPLLADTVLILVLVDVGLGRRSTPLLQGHTWS